MTASKNQKSINKGVFNRAELSGKKFHRTISVSRRAYREFQILAKKLGVPTSELLQDLIIEAVMEHRLK